VQEPEESGRRPRVRRSRRRARAESPEQPPGPPLPFEIDVRVKGPVRKSVLRLLKTPLERILRLDELNLVYEGIKAEGPSLEFLQEALATLGVGYEVSEEDLERVPKEGPVVVVANHPYGAIEGLVLMALMTEIRPDFKVLANYLLARMPKMRPYLVSVDPFGASTARTRNLGALKEAIAWLKDGGMLGTFPAGAVSHLRWTRPSVKDPKWHDSIARLVQRAETTVLPLFFEGRNGALFQLAGLVHSRLRTALLPRELLNKRHSDIRIRIGSPIPWKKLKRFEDPGELRDYLRFRTYLLAKRGPQASEPDPAPAAPEAGVAVAEPGPQELLAGEIRSLPEEALLAEAGEYATYRATREQAPHLVREIGRLREITFREAGEGTGEALDLDRFDDYYTHLLVWNREKQEVVGAYRVGRVDEIVRDHGLAGLYTRTLFKFRKRLVRQLGPALELGRSFVRKEYQREYAPLHLLWQGIGAFVVRRPEYKILIGPVSISSQYNSTTRQLLAHFLKRNRFDKRLGSLLKPTNPHKPKLRDRLSRRLTNRLVNDLEEVSTLVSELEADRQGVPILLKHYLRLGGQMLGFNVDPNFSDCLDGLICVDLRKAPVRILERHMGKEGTAAFLAYHQAGK
jgi:putative hemolysin